MKSLLLSATALAILGVPALSVAQTYRAPSPDHASQPAHAQPAWRPAPPAAPNPPGPVMRQPTGSPVNGDHGHGYAPQPTRGYGQGYQQGRGQYFGQRDGQQVGRPVGQPYGQGRGDSRDHAYRNDPGGDRRFGDGDRRGEGGYGGWEGRRGFEGYEGPRYGYWYAPGRGYYYPGAGAYGVAWALGAFVPYELRSCSVEDPYAYGVPPAPYGYCWIFLNDRLVMIDMRSGVIVRIAGGY